MKGYQKIWQKIIGLFGKQSSVKEAKKEPLKAKGLFHEDTPASISADFYNPLGCAANSYIKIDYDQIEDLACHNPFNGRNRRLKILEILEYSIPMNGQVHKFTDYVLCDPSFPEEYQGNRRGLRLRCVPDDSGYRAMALSIYDEKEYSEEFHNILKDSSKQFIVEEHHDRFGDPIIFKLQYWRVNDVGLSYAASVKALKDKNENGQIESDEISVQKIEFWDYSRIGMMDGKWEYEDFVFVEMDQSNGWFQIFRGAEVPNTQITVF